MKLEKTWLAGVAHALAVAVGFAVAVSLSYAKLPQAPMDDSAKAKAEEAKVKTTEETKKAREAEEKAMDSVAERYKKGKGVKTAATVEPKKK